MDNIKSDVVFAWSRVHKYLEKELPGHAIHAWFDPIVPVGFRENSFFLEVPNQFFLEWIESHYGDDIIKAIKMTYSEKIKYKILVSKKKNQKNEDRAFQSSTTQVKLKRFNTLLDKEVVSSQEYEEVLYNHNSVLSNFNSQLEIMKFNKINLDKCNIKAKFDGIISKKFLKSNNKKGIF